MGNNKSTLLEATGMGILMFVIGFLLVFSLRGCIQPKEEPKEEQPQRKVDTLLYTPFPIGEFNT